MNSTILRMGPPLNADNSPEKIGTKVIKQIDLHLNMSPCDQRATCTLFSEPQQASDWLRCDEDWRFSRDQKLCVSQYKRTRAPSDDYCEIEMKNTDTIYMTTRFTDGSDPQILKFAYSPSSKLSITDATSFCKNPQEPKTCNDLNEVMKNTTEIGWWESKNCTDPLSSASCQSHSNPDCHNLSGNCCPADDGKMLSCCSPSSPSSSCYKSNLKEMKCQSEDVAGEILVGGGGEIVIGKNVWS